MSRGPDAPEGRARALVAEHWPVVALAVVAVVVSVVVKRTVYPAYSFNRDEPVYLWQVRALADGKVFTSGGGMPRSFQPWLSGVSDGRFFSQYTLGWPLVLLAFDVVLGSASGAIAFGTALAVVGTYSFARVVTGERSVATVAAAVLVLSPLLVIQSGVYLGYLFSLGVGALFGACFLAGLRRRSTPLLVAAGLLVGWLFMTRPFDGVLWGVAIVGYGLVVERHELRGYARAVAWTALGVFPLLIATLAYNKHITGSFTDFPITAADSRDTFGYGLRSIGAHWPAVDFTAIMGLKGSGRNGVEMPPFLFGSYLAVAVALAGLWLRRRDRSTIVLLAIGAVFPLGYAIFWGISLSSSFAHVSGPIYFVPLLIPVCIFTATALVAAWRSSRGWTIALAVVMVAATVPFLVDRIDANHTVSESQAPWRDAVKLVHDRALVIVSRSGPYLLQLNPFSENSPDLDGRILYATDRGPVNLALLAAHPDRTPYLESTDLTTEQTLTETDIPVAAVKVTPITVQRGPLLTVHVTVTNTTGDPFVVASLRVGTAPAQTRVLSTTSTRGESFDTEWQVAVAPGTTGAITASPALGSVLVDAGTGTGTEAALAGPHDRLRLSYRVDGTRLEVLEPGTPVRFRTVDGTVKPRHAASLDTLSVDVTRGT
jgi:4-amino-4-deoxy-L-arabinose transferase-like glycosyltransferase